MHSDDNRAFGSSDGFVLIDLLTLVVRMSFDFGGESCRSIVLFFLHRRLLALFIEAR